MSVSQSMLAGIFSDETEYYRSPVEPDPGDTVRLRIRVPRGMARRVLLWMGKKQPAVLACMESADDDYEWYSAYIVCGREEVRYRFLIEDNENRVASFDRGGAALWNEESRNKDYLFRFKPGFHLPTWARGAVQYQIFTDRFRNGDAGNDVEDNEYYYTVGHAKKIPDWNAKPNDTDIRNFYGGDLQGIIDSLDYLEDLGVEAVYLNPIFVSPSSHKYDIQDYEHVDPHFGVIVDDMEHVMQSWEKHNGYAPRYIRRVTSMENLKRSDALFEKLCRELHARKMRIILDGVFNHCGSFNKWMDCEGVYLGKKGFEPGAYQSSASPYRRYFHFHESGNGRSPAYEGWWGYATLPKLNYEDSPELEEKILSIAEKWASPPYRIDGWRLDVAADLGHSPEYNHSFWRKFRERVKKANPDLLIIAEHYGDPSEWLQGDQWDTVMNYDAFMEPVTWFLTGMEKHSDSRRDDLYRNGKAFFEIMQDRMAKLGASPLLCAMNELSNHDHSRFLTRTNRTVGRLTTLGPDAAGENINKGVFRQAVMMQMTWPGAPTIYYADEAGQVGWTDPDDRRTYPWGHEDHELLSLHRELISLRKEYPVLRDGSLKPLLGDCGRISYARFNESRRMIIAVNANDESMNFRICAKECGAKENELFSCRMMTTESGHNDEPDLHRAVTEGYISFDLPACSSCIMVN